MPDDEHSPEIAWAFERNLDTEERRVLLICAMAEHIDGSGSARISLETLAKRAAMPVADAEEALDRLVRRGCLEVVERERRGRAARYRCNLDCRCE